MSAAGEGTDSDDPAGLLMRRMIDSFAEYEKALISCRTRSALAAKRRRGERTSRFAPFGYQVAADGRRLELDDNEQEVLRRIRSLQVAGRSLRMIAADLNEEWPQNALRGTLAARIRAQRLRSQVMDRPLKSIA